ncbi:MAG: hypothetical protein IJ111_02120 [Eggerthellaceae bacterium]|nr:hypothetical protein [Eggerthellaceae bacterium]
MTLIYNGNPNPNFVVFNGMDLDKVVFNPAGTADYYTVWEKDENPLVGHTLSAVDGTFTADVYRDSLGLAADWTVHQKTLDFPVTTPWTYGTVIVYHVSGPAMGDYCMTEVYEPSKSVLVTVDGSVMTAMMHYQFTYDGNDFPGEWVFKIYLRGITGNVTKVQIPSGTFTEEVYY